MAVAEPEQSSSPVKQQSRDRRRRTRLLEIREPTRAEPAIKASTSLAQSVVAYIVDSLEDRRALPEQRNRPIAAALRQFLCRGSDRQRVVWLTSPAIMGSKRGRRRSRVLFAHRDHEHRRLQLSQETRSASAVDDVRGWSGRPAFGEEQDVAAAWVANLFLLEHGHGDAPRPSV
jgi:hypothetical protein